MAYGNYAPFYRGGYFNPNQAMPMNDMQNQQFVYQQPQMQQPQAQPAPMQNPIVPPTQSTNDIIWVQGEAGAKAYLVAPNNTVTLWDSESPTIYLKTADINGVPSMRILDFKERTANVAPAEHVCKCGEKYVTKEQFKDLESKFEQLSAKFEESKPKTAAKSKKTEAEE